MSKKYIVSYRYGTELLAADLCGTKKEAEEKAEAFLYDACVEAWDNCEIGDAPDSVEELQQWAEDNGFVYSDSFFWDGSSDGYEALITEAQEPGFTVNVVDGEVFIDGQFVSQLCWDNDAVGAAIVVWLNENKGGVSNG